MKFLIYLFVSFLFLINLHASNIKREFRGAWIATIKNIDWPSIPNLPVEVQKKELTELLNNLQEAGLNAVLLQVRSGCDAIYQSDLEPWSYWITGKQGRIPEPFYDPLEFAIRETHKRGMELHAWFNPFRVGNSKSKFKVDSSHISITHPEWIIETGDYQFLNPGLTQVRDYTIQIIEDVVRRYDIDGVHFDDYFYPYNGINNEDKSTFEQNNRMIKNIDDWRRNNINIFIKEVNEKIKSIKPWVKFGISPFGIWKDGIPSETTGFSSYHKIYSDAIHWLKNKSLDYIAPQIYWKIGGPQDYSKLSDWWSNQSYDRHVFIGHALYKMSREEESWPAKEITNQIKLNRLNPKIKGSIFFRAIDILNNVNGVKDSLKNKYYNSPAIIPQMSWLDSIPPPLFPLSLRAINSSEGTFLQWQNHKLAAEEDIIHFNVVYRFEMNEEIDIGKGKNIIGIIPACQSSFMDSTGTPNETYTYLVTALDKMYNESDISNAVSIKFSQIELCSHKTPLATSLNKVDSVITTNRTRIKFFLQQKEQVNLSIFEDNGEKILTLINEELFPGTYRVILKFNTTKTAKLHYKLATPTFSEMNSFIVQKQTSTNRI